MDFPDEGNLIFNVLPLGQKYAMLKLKVLLSTILRNFKVTSSCTQKDFKLQGDIILKRADGFRIKLEERRCVEY